MQARILIIGGILESDEKEALDKIIKTEAIDVVFTHYLTNSQSKNGKKLKAAVLDKYDIWEFNRSFVLRARRLLFCLALTFIAKLN